MNVRGSNSWLHAQTFSIQQSAFFGMMSTTTYVYCVLHRARTPVLRGMPPGIPGGSLPRLLPVAARLWIVASEVPRLAYAPEAIERHLRDLDWVSGIALAHEAVVERMTRVSGATVVPMKLFTMFSGPELAIGEMRSRSAQLKGIVKHISGCDEWGVRVMRGNPGAAARPRTTDASSGTAFLAARKQIRDAAREQTATMIAAAEDVLTSLGRVAKATRQRPAPDGASSPPLLDAAFLVPESRKARFRAAAKEAAARCSDAGAELTLTGPWPAYNFIDTPGTRS
jgi:hypothetical protein